VLAGVFVYERLDENMTSHQQQPQQQQQGPLYTIAVIVTPENERDSVNFLQKVALRVHDIPRCRIFMTGLTSSSTQSMLIERTGLEITFIQPCRMGGDIQVASKIMESSSTSIRAVIFLNPLALITDPSSGNPSVTPFYPPDTLFLMIRVCHICKITLCLNEPTASALLHSIAIAKHPHFQVSQQQETSSSSAARRRAISELDSQKQAHRRTTSWGGLSIIGPAATNPANQDQTATHSSPERATSIPAHLMRHSGSSVPTTLVNSQPVKAEDLALSTSQRTENGQTTLPASIATVQESATSPVLSHPTHSQQNNGLRQGSGSHDNSSPSLPQLDSYTDSGGYIGEDSETVAQDDSTAQDRTDDPSESNYISASSDDVPSQDIETVLYQTEGNSPRVSPSIPTDPSRHHRRSQSIQNDPYIQVDEDGRFSMYKMYGEQEEIVHLEDESSPSPPIDEKPLSLSAPVKMFVVYVFFFL